MGQGAQGAGGADYPERHKIVVFKYDVDGQDKWLTFGQYPKLKLAEALRKYAEALEKLEAGDDPAEENVRANRASRKALTVRQLAGEYIEKYAKPRKRSWREDQRIAAIEALSLAIAQRRALGGPSR